MNIPLPAYLAYNEPQACKNILQQFGYGTSARNYQQLAADMQSLVNKHGEDALTAIAQVHPDKDLIMWACSEKTEKKPAETSSCSSCSLKSACKGSASPVPTNEFLSPTQTFILFGCFLVTAIVIAKI